MPKLKPPGVYVEEISVSPKSVAEVETAIPAFIGYTSMASKRRNADLVFRPTKISSLSEYTRLFGESQPEPMHVSLTSGAHGLNVGAITPKAPRQLMWYAMKLFFDNGGQECYVISVGDYGQPVALKALLKGIQQAASIDEITMLVTPEATVLPANEYATLVQAQLAQCFQLADRFCILDLFDGDKPLSATELAVNRTYFGTTALEYGACYYPFLHTQLTWQLASSSANVTANIDGSSDFNVASLQFAKVNLFNEIQALLKRCYVTLPPSSIMAGVYTQIDQTRGVWKAPAGVAITGVSSPTVDIDDPTNEMLNIDSATGKSVNAIRTIANRGTLVWGARTLAGNSDEWRYVPVRRFVNVVRESVEKYLKWAAFEPNDARTWQQITSVIDNYLTNKWREGALIGAKPNEAWYVHCGLNSTMTANDINQGRMIIEIGMALSRPAEFIVLRITLHNQSP